MVLVKVESFIFPADFVILDCEVDFEVPIILGRPFLATGRALVDMEKGQMTFQLNNEEATFNICRTMRQSGELQSVSAISHKEKMKKENEQKIAKQEFMVGDLVLLVSSGVPCLPSKLKSHAPLNLQEVGFGGSKTHCDAATDGRSDCEKAHRDNP